MKNNFPKKEKVDNKVIVGYIPHGSNSEIFRRIDESDEEYKEVESIREKLYGTNDVKFALLFNSRNLGRKGPGQIVMSFSEFVKKLPAEERDSVRMVFHTQPIDDNGTDLPRIIEDLVPEIKHLFVFSAERVEPKILNRIYNCVDAVISLSTNEGFGIGTLEGILAERMMISNVTGGLQDQMGFMNDKGEYLHEDVDFTLEWGSNHDGRFRNCGKWAIPVFPSNRFLQGSPPTPYIFDDRVSFEDAAEAIHQCYSLSKEQRREYGKLGREYALTEAFNAKEMGRRFIEGIDHVLNNWTPRKRHGMFKV